MPDHTKASELSTLTVTGRKGNRVDGRLRCGFCRVTMEVHWYPDSPDQDMTRNLASLHFGECPERGDVWTVELTVFDGDKRERRALALFRA
jgi:hypothetical protein